MNDLEAGAAALRDQLDALDRDKETLLKDVRDLEAVLFQAEQDAMNAITESDDDRARSQLHTMQERLEAATALHAEIKVIEAMVASYREVLERLAPE